MKEIIIYEFQLDEIIDALRMTSNLYDSSKGETCFDRTVRQAKQYAENAKNDNKDITVRFGKNVSK